MENSFASNRLYWAAHAPRSADRTAVQKIATDATIQDIPLVVVLEGCDPMDDLSSSTSRRSWSSYSEELSGLDCFSDSIANIFVSRMEEKMMRLENLSAAELHKSQKYANNALHSRPT